MKRRSDARAVPASKTGVRRQPSSALGPSLLRQEQAAARRRGPSKVSLPALLACLPDAVALTDANGRVLSFNDKFQRATGLASTELAGRPIVEFLHLPDRDGAIAAAMAHLDGGSDDPLSGQVVLGRRGNGGRRSNLHVARLDDGKATGLLFVLRDIVPEQRLQRRIERAARTDALTGLLNRAAFTSEMELAIKSAARAGQRLGLLFIDLDGFKAINDSHGHEAGDRTLREVADRFARAVRRDDLLGRWGGDEFACLVRLPAGDKAILEVAERLLVEASLPLPPPVGVGLGASIGIARMPDDATSVSSFLRCADQALYEAKARSGRTWCAFAPAIAQRSTERARLRHDIGRAINAGELQLFYQPIVDATTLEPHGFEALIRWLHPERGVLSPGAFLSLLTTSGDKTMRLLEVQTQRALADAEQVLRAAPEIALNVDARLIGRTEAFSLLKPLQTAVGAVGGTLCVEVTEAAFDEHPEKLQSFIQDVRHNGMRLAIDDFGVGQASLLRLRDIRFDILKVDRSFVRSIAVSGRDRKISALAAQVAAELSGTSVAEGVETAAQVAWARQLGYHALQGFRIARPMPASAVPAWRARWSGVERRRLLEEMLSLGENDLRPWHATNLSDN